MYHLTAVELALFVFSRVQSRFFFLVKKAFSLVTISRSLVVSYSDCGSFMCEHEPVEPLR